jgi:Domain of unknown function (DUF4145)
VQLPCEILERQPGASLLEHLLQESALLLWKDWPREMEVLLFQLQNRTFTLRGKCPHGPHESAFLLVTSVYTEQNTNNWVAGMQCQGCAKFILAVLKQGIAGNVSRLYYQEHYPIGKPSDDVAVEIPEHIGLDFKEALRCLWVNAYNATAEMCRRALEASCIERGAAPKDVLEDMIDDLESKRVITPFLRDVAHKIRLGGNRGAHPGGPAIIPAPVANSDPATAQQLGIPTSPSVITEEHAKAIVKFTTEFFHHVYVVPKQLDKYDFSRPKV